MPENKRYSEAQKRAIYKHKQKIDEIRLSLPKGKKAEYQEAASEEGKSLNRFILDAVNEHLENGKENDGSGR